MEEEACDAGLSVGVGSVIGDERKHNLVQFHVLFPIHPKEEEKEQFDKEKKGRRRFRKSSTTAEEEEEEEEDLGCGNGGNKKDGSRKKLRLTKEQISLLEDSFRQHNTPNPIQKKELAKILTLRTRQVEVWFQNKRARTKLKQTEVDCDFLKKCSERLSGENQRLKKELIDLRSKMPVGSQIYMPITKATLKICPSCGKTTASDDGGDSETKCDTIAVAAAVESYPKIGGTSNYYVISC